MSPSDSQRACALRPLLALVTLQKGLGRKAPSLVMEHEYELPLAGAACVCLVYQYGPGPHHESGRVGG